MLTSKREFLHLVKRYSSCFLLFPLRPNDHFFNKLLNPPEVHRVLNVSDDQKSNLQSMLFSFIASQQISRDIDRQHAVVTLLPLALSLSSGDKTEQEIVDQLMMKKVNQSRSEIDNYLLGYQLLTDLPDRSRVEPLSSSESFSGLELFGPIVSSLGGIAALEFPAAGLAIAVVGTLADPLFPYVRAAAERAMGLPPYYVSSPKPDQLNEAIRQYLEKGAINANANNKLGRILLTPQIKNALGIDFGMSREEILGKLPAAQKEAAKAAFNSTQVPPNKEVVLVKEVLNELLQKQQVAENKIEELIKAQRQHEKKEQLYKELSFLRAEMSGGVQVITLLVTIFSRDPKEAARIGAALSVSVELIHASMMYSAALIGPWALAGAGASFVSTLMNLGGKSDIDILRQWLERIDRKLDAIIDMLKGVHEQLRQVMNSLREVLFETLVTRQILIVQLDQIRRQLSVVSQQIMINERHTEMNKFQLMLTETRLIVNKNGESQAKINEKLAFFHVHAMSTAAHIAFAGDYVSPPSFEHMAREVQGRRRLDLVFGLIPAMCRMVDVYCPAIYLNPVVWAQGIQCLLETRLKFYGLMDSESAQELDSMMVELWGKGLELRDVIFRASGQGLISAIQHYNDAANNLVQTLKRGFSEFIALEMKEQDFLTIAVNLRHVEIQLVESFTITEDPGTIWACTTYKEVRHIKVLSGRDKGKTLGGHRKGLIDKWHGEGCGWFSIGNLGLTESLDTGSSHRERSWEHDDPKDLEGYIKGLLREQGYFAGLKDKFRKWFIGWGERQDFARFEGTVAICQSLASLSSWRKFGSQAKFNLLDVTGVGVTFGDKRQFQNAILEAIDSLPADKFESPEWQNALIESINKLILAQIRVLTSCCYYSSNRGYSSTMVEETLKRLGVFMKMRNIDCQPPPKPVGVVLNQDIIETLPKVIDLMANSYDALKGEARDTSEVIPLTYVPKVTLPGAEDNLLYDFPNPTWVAKIFTKERDSDFSQEDFNRIVQVVQLCIPAPWIEQKVIGDDHSSMEMWVARKQYYRFGPLTVLLTTITDELNQTYDLSIALTRK